ncbi:nucleoside hydrolase [Deinococcus sp. Arct2-2]|uniref:nucleoside hydrolase n=1 Tax=Deinococcus sp. Arct2-2 TaxID=2568653 RepID=UPI0010A57715|nr:nucleoside hydrolase [Deinococcus sp. Arct2-2]THF66746.1 nucleoside hydrolase [Deinococcus sp. Arct2-2]
MSQGLIQHFPPLPKIMGRLRQAGDAKTSAVEPDHRRQQMHKILLDTDIGTDIDDILALSFLLASPEIELLGITTAYGNTVLRGKIAYQVLAHLGRAGQIPIAAGQPATLTSSRPIFWPGHEGKNIDHVGIPDHVLLDQPAEDFILETVKAQEGEVTILAIAPLGNLARAILKAPDTMARVKRIYMMGGVFGRNDPTFLLPVTEHNIHSDPEAAQVVFESGLPITLVPLDVTTKTRLGQEELQALGEVDHPLARLLHAELSAWLPFVQAHDGREFTHMHDPLTAALLLRPALVVHSQSMCIGVETQGVYTTGQTVPISAAGFKHVEVVLQIDAPAFQSFFLERVLQLPVANPPNLEPLPEESGPR